VQVILFVLIAVAMTLVYLPLGIVFTQRFSCVCAVPVRPLCTTAGLPAPARDQQSTDLLALLPQRAPPARRFALATFFAHESTLRPIFVRATVG